MVQQNVANNSNQEKPSIYKKVFASYAISLALFIFLVCFCFLFFGAEVIEKIFENFFIIVIAMGAIAYPFVSKRLK